MTRLLLSLTIFVTLTLIFLFLIWNVVDIVSIAKRVKQTVREETSSVVVNFIFAFGMIATSALLCFLHFLEPSKRHHDSVESNKTEIVPRSTHHVWITYHQLSKITAELAKESALRSQSHGKVRSKLPNHYQHQPQVHRSTLSRSTQNALRQLMNLDPRIRMVPIANAKGRNNCDLDENASSSHNKVTNLTRSDENVIESQEELILAPDQESDLTIVDIHEDEAASVSKSKGVDRDESPGTEENTDSMALASDDDLEDLYEDFEMVSFSDCVCN